MPVKPVSFQGDDLKVVAAGDLDPSVLPSTVVMTDGSTPFTAAQTGVTPSTDAHLATQGSVKTLLKAQAWQGTVKSITTSAQPGSPVTGDRYILPVGATGAAWATHDKQIAEWGGSSWTFTTPLAGWTAYVVDTDIFVRYSATLTSWSDVSGVLTHEQLKGLLGGASNDHYHLTNAQYTVLTGSHPARQVLAAPTGGAGAPVSRALEAADIQSGQVSAARGGLGVDASAVSGYPKWATGTPSFSATIPWGDISGAPSGFTPAAHAASHASGGTDPVSLDAAQITSGALAANRGGTGHDGSSVAAHKVLAAPTGSSGAVDYRLLVPDDISGATGANQVLQRNTGNTANVWQVIDTTSLGAVPTSRLVATGTYLTGGGSLSSNLTLNWAGVDIELSGSTIARRPIINLTGSGVTAVDNPGQNRVDVTIGSGAATLDPIVAALIFGG